MKCLSVRQPWADAIIKGIPVGNGQTLFKDVENRSRRFNHQGRILIHAPLTFDHDGWLWIQETFDCILPNPEDHQLGGFIGEVNITGCVVDSPSRWAAKGQKHLLLSDPVELPFFPIKGQRGLWNEPKCRVCGCTTYKSCPGGCFWVNDNICSSCSTNSGGDTEVDID